MFPAVLVAGVSVGAALVGVRRLRAVARLFPDPRSGLREAVQSGNADGIRIAVEKLFDDEGDRAVLSLALLGGGNQHAAVAALNEHLAQVERGLDVGRAVPKSLGRAALASGTFAAVAELGASVSSARGAAWAPAMSEFVAGALGAVLAFELDRRSATRAERVRQAWDEIAAVFARRLADEPAERDGRNSRATRGRLGPSWRRGRGSNGGPKS